MVTNGKCCACHEVAEKDEHHIIPRRFTRKGKEKLERLDILFPEAFPSGVNDMVDSRLCRKCHQRLDRIIPFDRLMTPDKYFLVLEIFISGERITKDIINQWVRESDPEIKKRQQIYFDLSDEYEEDFDSVLLANL